jgi:hypothetical protein
LPPWQLVEQQSAPAPQEFPRVVQVALLPDTVMAWHLPPVHVPEQHCEAAVQLWPTDWHAPLPQVPVAAPAARVQVRSQQSALRPQLAPAAAQNVEELQCPVFWPAAMLHAVEQQSALVAQLSPPAWQAFWTGAAQTPPAHWPEQQSLATAHFCPPATHWSVGSTQTFDAHWFVQQSALEPQT